MQGDKRDELKQGGQSRALQVPQFLKDGPNSGFHNIYEMQREVDQHFKEVST